MCPVWTTYHPRLTPWAAFLRRFAATEANLALHFFRGLLATTQTPLGRGQFTVRTRRWSAGLLSGVPAGLSDSRL